MRQELPKCPECGQGRLNPLTRTEEFDFDFGDETVKVQVENVPVEMCDHYGEVICGPAAARLQDDAICRAAGLLTPAEIKAIRDNFGWSQQHLADLTGLGIATISRWERGRLMQNRSNNKVLLALRDCAEFREYLEGLLSGKDVKHEPARANGGDGGRPRDGRTASTHGTTR
jgi:putative zinc finger/helix-turn-helix YgiT family protein